MKPTVQQQAVMDLFESQFGPIDAKVRQAIFVEAVAGSGKTTLLMQLVGVILKIVREQPGRKVSGMTVSFNTHIKKEIEARLIKIGANGSMQAKTTNGLGFAILNAVGGKGKELPEAKVEPKKYTAIVKAELQRRGHFYPKWKMINAAVKLADFCRLTMVEPTEANMIQIVMHYDLSKEVDILDENWSDIWQSARDAISTGIREYKRTGLIDFTDQIYLPLKLELASPIYDVLFIDEAQDLNQVRLQLILRSIKPNGQLVFVGDANQAIQGFCGADTDSVNTIVKATGAKMMPLSVCFRSASKIVDMAKQIVPHIEARENADEGVVEIIPEQNFLSMLHEGELDVLGNVVKDPSFVLCRTKAPLAAKCMACLRLGKRAVIRGKSIGEMLIGLIEKFAKLLKTEPEYMSLDDLKSGSEIYRERQERKLSLSDDADEKIAELSDTLETFFVLVEAYIDQESGNFSVSRLGTFIESKFTDSDKTAINFSTVHKSKGLEYDDVHVLEPQLMPLKYAKLAWQIQQEWNLIYVAITRAKHNLYFVGSVPGGLLLPDVEQPEMEMEEEAVEDVLEEEVMVVAPKSKAGRKTKESKGEERDTYLQFSLSPEEKETISLMRELYSQEIGKEVTLSYILKQVIKASPVYQQAEVQYSEGVRPVKANKNAGKTPNAVKA